MTIQALQFIGIGIDDVQCLVVLTGTGKFPSGLHIALAATFAAAELAVASYHFIGASHFICQLGVGGQGYKRQDYTRKEKFYKFHMAIVYKGFFSFQLFRPYDSCGQH